MGLNQRLMAWTMANAAAGYETAMEKRKKDLLANLSGQILEIGPGTGPNLRYFNPDVQWTGVEPNPHMIPYLKQEAKTQGLSITVKQIPLEEFNAPSHFDYVICTLVLCSVPNLSQTIQTIYSLLKPGGKFLFVEHVAAPEGSLLRQVQEGIRPFWSWIGEGCQLNRQTGEALNAAGFSSVTYDDFDAPVPLPIIRPHISGIATK